MGSFVNRPPPGAEANVAFAPAALKLVPGAAWHRGLPSVSWPTGQAVHRTAVLRALRPIADEELFADYGCDPLALQGL